MLRTLIIATLTLSATLLVTAPAAQAGPCQLGTDVACFYENHSADRDAECTEEGGSSGRTEVSSDSGVAQAEVWGERYCDRASNDDTVHSEQVGIRFTAGGTSITVIHAAMDRDQGGYQTTECVAFVSIQTENGQNVRRTLPCLPVVAMYKALPWGTIIQ